MASVTIATSPTAYTPAPLPATRGKERRRLKGIAMKAPHRRDPRGPSSTGRTTSTVSNHVRTESVAPVVEPAAATSDAGESTVPEANRP